jgi:TonB family protein
MRSDRSPFSTAALITILAVLASVAFCGPVRAADCPVTLSDLNIDGRSSDGSVLVYGVTIHAQGAPQAQLRISASDVDKKLTSLDLPRLTPRSNSKNIWRKRFGWSGPMLSGLQLSAVSSAKDVEFATCQAGITPVQESTYPTAIRTFADPPARAVPPIGAVEDPPSSMIVDSDFIQKVRPAYPEIAKELGISGTVMVTVDIRPDGKAHNVRVNYSSQDSTLDLAAAAAAEHSTFKPPLYDGQPSSRSYQIEYDFMLESAPQQAKPTCSASIMYSWVAGLDTSTGEVLYNVGLESSSKDINAASLDLQKQKGHVLSIVASPLHWVDSYNRKSFEAEISIVDTIPLSDAAILRATLGGTGQWSDCPGNSVLTWDDTDGALEQAQFDVPQTAAPAKVALPVRFDREIFPRYPDEAATAREEGTAVVVIDANRDGKPTAVRVFNSSKSWRLDDAATQAAWLSTYPKMDHPVMYRADYDFELHVPGVKYGS